MKLVFLDTKTLGSDINLDGFNKFGQVTKYETTSKEQTLERVKDADIVITNKVVIDKDIMENSSIKLICIAATGMNNVDLDYAKDANIEVKNVAGYSTSSVAQVTLSLVLNFVQKLDYYSNYTKTKQWEDSDIFTHIEKPFFELEGKKWGIIGLGSIGQKVAHIAQAFGCEVSYYSTSGKNTNTQYKNVSLEELLKESDIISIHCALTQATSNLLNETNLELLKENSIVVNVGRGGIINEADLVKVFKKKNFYCALDVVEKEPIAKNTVLNEILEDEKFVITPHIAWASIEARNKLINLIIKNIDEFVL